MQPRLASSTLYVAKDDFDLLSLLASAKYWYERHAWPCLVCPLLGCSPELMPAERMLSPLGYSSLAFLVVFDFFEKFQNQNT